MPLPITPSNLDRRYLCPGSATLEAAAPNESTPAAERGIRLHTAMAEWVETGVCSDMERGYLDGKDADALEWIHDQVKPLLDEATANGALILSEYRLDLSGLGIEPDDPERGRVDLAIVYPGARAILIDYKFGRGFVSHPRWNWQFRAYAAGLWQNFGGAEVLAMKLQPHASEEDGRRQEYRFTEHELQAIAPAVRAIVAAAEAEDAPLVPGTKQCQYCAARATCPARTGAVMTMPRHLAVKDHLLQMSPPERADFFEKLLVAEGWVSDAIQTCEDFIIGGPQGVIPGFALGEGRKTRAWKDPVGALPALRATAVDAGKDPEQLVETAVVSVAQAEKILGKKAFAKLAEHVETKPGNPKVIREK